MRLLLNLEPFLKINLIWQMHFGNFPACFIVLVGRLMLKVHQWASIALIIIHLYNVDLNPYLDQEQLAHIPQTVF